MRRLWRSQSGQILPFAAIMVLLFSLAVFAFMGAAVAEGVHAKLQTAADAAALAATDQAVLWEELGVQRHSYWCTPTKKGWSCSDSAYEVVSVEGTAAQLFPKGWITDADCQYTSDRAAHIPPRPNPAGICDSWRLGQAGFRYPLGSDPKGVAARSFAENTSRLDAHGVPASLTDMQINTETGAVQVTAQAVETANPLGVLLHRPVWVRVRADSRPHLTRPLKVSGS